MVRHRTAEIVALKESEPLGFDLFVVFLCLHLFSKHLDLGAADAAHQLFAFARAGEHDVDLDIVGHFDQGFELRLPDKVVERQAEAQTLEPATRGDQFGGWFQILQDLQNRGGGWQDFNHVPGERLHGAVNEGRLAPGKLLDAEEDGVVEHDASGLVAISAKGQFRAGAEQQLVSVDLSAKIQDGLARQIAQPSRQLLNGGSVDPAARYRLDRHSDLPMSFIGHIGLDLNDCCRVQHRALPHFTLDARDSSGLSDRGSMRPEESRSELVPSSRRPLIRV